MIKRKHNINIRLDDNELEKLKKICNHLNMSISEYVRDVLFNQEKVNWEKFKLKMKLWLDEKDSSFLD